MQILKGASKSVKKSMKPGKQFVHQSQHHSSIFHQMYKGVMEAELTKIMCQATSRVQMIEPGKLLGAPGTTKTAPETLGSGLFSVTVTEAAKC